VRHGINGKGRDEGVTPHDDFREVRRPLSFWTKGYDFGVEYVDAARVPVLVASGTGRYYNPDLEIDELLLHLQHLGLGVFAEKRLRPREITQDEIDRVVSFSNDFGPLWSPEWERSQMPGHYPSISQVIEEARVLSLCMWISQKWPAVPTEAWKGFGLPPAIEPDDFLGMEFPKHLRDVALMPILSRRPGRDMVVAYYYESLLGAIWLRYFENLTGIIQRRCAFRKCGALLTKISRKDQQYCDNYCADAERQARRREKKQKEARNARSHPEKR
jgi:hypothetical protein